MMRDDYEETQQRALEMRVAKRDRKRLHAAGICDCCDAPEDDEGESERERREFLQDAYYFVGR